LVASDRGLAAILWENDDPKRVPLALLVEDKNHPVLRETERQLNDLLRRQTRKVFPEIRFRRTEFQKKCGGRSRPSLRETRSYGDIARQIGRPKAVRAVGAANGKNSYLHHRPVPQGNRSNGKLTASQAAWRPKPSC